jgi:pimeloyl-ACP methyl ester carboxylesterase
MELNSIIFPAPRQSYNREDYPDQLVWVPKIPDQFSIPCLYLEYQEGSSKVMIYFHGNAEDLGQAFEVLETLRSVLHIHIFAVEYPGYGLYSGKPTSESILNDAECVYSFLLSSGVKPENIIVFGRSIGSGPATYLASTRKVGCLMLMSAYTSIKAAAKSLAGKFGSLIKERFENVKKMPQVTCPTFFVHGMMDKVIPYTHSQVLHEACKGPSSLFLPPLMSHNNFDYCDDLILPIATFLSQSGISVVPDDDFSAHPRIPWEFFQPPASQVVKKVKKKTILSRRKTLS